MFETYTYEYLLEEVLNNAPEGIDTRQGSIFYDAVSGILIQIARLYDNLDTILNIVSLDTATGDALDAKASEYGITRKAAIPARYHVTFEGTIPDVGERFYTNGIYFVLGRDDQGVYYLEAEIAGEDANNIAAGTAAIPVNTIIDLISATFGEIYTYGEDEEDDDSLRTRVQEKLSGSAENGNKQHYKTWCEEVEGVGLARIFPLWNGPNTVKAVLIDGLGHGTTDAKTAEVQEYVDPATMGYTATVDGITYVVGDGLGEGVANLGAHFTAYGAMSLQIDVQFNAEIKGGYTKDDVEKEASELIEEHFTELALDWDEDTPLVVRLTTVGYLLSGMDSIIDYSDLTLNREAVNISIGDNYVPMLGDVEVTEV